MWRGIDQTLSAYLKEIKMAEIKKTMPQVALVSEESTESTITGTPKIKKSWELERQRDRKMVRGKFLFHEIPGGEMTFNFYKYKGDPIEKYTFKDGEIYTIPLGVAKHLNTIGTPVHEHAQDENGLPLMKIGSFERRCTFQSLEFLGEDSFDAPPKIYTVERETGLVK
jgi:hypothetical protein